MGAQQAILATDEMEFPDAVATRAPSPPPCQLVTDDTDSSPYSDLEIELPEDDIRHRSQQIWESEGRPEGYAEDHWRRARAELAALMARTSTAPLAPRPADDMAPSVSVLVPEAPPSAAVPATQPEDSDGVGEQQILLLHDVVVLPPQDEPVVADPRPLRMPPPQGSPQTAVVPSIISAGLVLRGALESSGDIQFDGIMNGDIFCASLTVGEASVIQGDVTADGVLVRGRVQGRICARKVYLSASARVEGDILYEAFTVEDGAYFEGRVQRLEEPSLAIPAVYDAAIG